MTIGPLEYIVVGFPGNQFNGAIAPALAKLIDSNTIRILDLLFIAKDAEGDVVAVEFDELDELAAFADLDGEAGGIITPEDVESRPRGSNRTPRRRCSSGKTCGRRSSRQQFVIRAACCSKAAASRTSSRRSRSRTCPRPPDPPLQGDCPMLRRRPIARTVARTQSWREPQPLSPAASGATRNKVRRAGAGRRTAAGSRLRGGAAPAPAAGGMSPDAIQQLKDLAALKEQGILTEDEFAAQKAKILSA